MRNKLSEILTRARRLKGDSLRKVEEETGISNAYLSQLESGAIREPSPHKLRSLADYYSLAYESLMEAAGYIQRGDAGQRDQKAKSADFMFLRDQNLTDDEAAALNAFLAHLRQQKSPSRR